MKITEESIRDIALPVLEEEGLILCGIRITGSSGRPLVQVYIDREKEFITISKCVEVTRSVKNLIDMQEHPPSDYRLEVSSPGVESPMSNLWQFRKNIGRYIKLEISEGSVEGEIMGISDEDLILLKTGDESHEYSLSEVSGASVVLSMPRKPKIKRKRNEARRS